MALIKTGDQVVLISTKSDQSYFQCRDMKVNDIYTVRRGQSVPSDHISVTLDHPLDHPTYPWAILYPNEVSTHLPYTVDQWNID